MSTATSSARPIEPMSPSVDTKGHRDRFAPSSPLQPTAEKNSQTSAAESPSAKNVIDMDTFQQILDLDEDGELDFSWGMVEAYFTQAQTTFAEMDAALKSKDLSRLSSLGHFLKGSSAALGVFKVQASCERMQHYGQLRDEEARLDLSNEEALGKIEHLLEQVKIEYGDAEEWLRNYYEKEER